jgi:hypothetical protein
MQWPVLELAEWEELRQCPGCGRLWLATWPEDVEGGMILCSPEPTTARRLKDIDRITTLRAYCLARLEEHLGPLKERKLDCRKVGCTRKRLEGANYCLEHVIADRFGRHLARLDPISRPDR